MLEHIYKADSLKIILSGSLGLFKEYCVGSIKTSYSDILRKPISYILIGNLILFIIGIWWGLPSSESWLSDSLAPYYPLLGLSQGFSFGYLNKYPLVHQFLLALLNLPVVIAAFINSHPAEGLQLSKFLMLIRSEHYATILIITDRLVSVFMGVGIVYGMYKSVKLLFGEKAALFSSILLSFNGVLNFYAHVAKVEVPYLFWGVWGMYMLIRVVKFEETRDYVLLALFACLSYGTKDQGYALFLIPFIFFLVIYKAVYREPMQSVRQALFRKNFLIFAVAFIVISLITQNIFFNLEGFIYRFRILTGWNSQRSISYTLAPAGLFALFYDVTRAVISDGMGFPGFVVCTAGALVFIIRRHRAGRDFWAEAIFLIASASVYLFFIQVVRQDNIRHSLPITVFMTAYGGYLLSLISDKMKHKYSQLFKAAFACLCLYSFYFTFSVNMNFLNEMRYSVETWMHKNIQKKSVIEYYAYLHYLPRFPKGTFSYRVTNDAMDIEKRHPDYIVLTSHYYPRYFGGTEDIVRNGRIVNTQKAIRRRKTTDMQQYLTLLMNGRLNYDVACDFRSEKKWYRKVGYARISPNRVIVYKRKSKALKKSSGDGK